MVMEEEEKEKEDEVVVEEEEEEKAEVEEEVETGRWGWGGWRARLPLHFIDGRYQTWHQTLATSKGDAPPPVSRLVPPPHSPPAPSVTRQRRWCRPLPPGGVDDVKSLSSLDSPTADGLAPQ